MNDRCALRREDLSANNVSSLTGTTSTPTITTAVVQQARENEWIESHVHHSRCVR